jgi:protein translocase SEC61 complex gamma subunit
LGVRSFLQSTKRLFQVAQKPDWQEVSLLIKITAIGVLLIGFTGFIIRILFWLVGLYQIPTSVQPTTPTG